MSERVILHVDLNNFYASVEQVLNPDLKNKPIAVCGDPNKRHGIVLAKSSIAKQYGVQTAEPIWRAKQKCRDLIIVSPHYAEYVKYSKLVREIYLKYTPQVESFGLDECWLDVTGSIKLFGSGEEIAEKIRKEVKEVTGGLTVSIGVSFNKVFAKLGSDLKKPDAISIIDTANYKKVAWPLKANEMLYVGKSTYSKLKEFNINTIGDLANTDKGFLIETFGKSGETMFNSANGLDQEEVKYFTEENVPESIGNGTTTPKDVSLRNEAKSVIYALCEMIAFRLRSIGAICSFVSISIRDCSLNTHSKQGHLIAPTCSSDLIAKRALELLDDLYDFSKNKPIRTITVTVFKLSLSGDMVQSFIWEEVSQKNEQLDKSIDKLREKYGYNVLQRAINIGTIFTCDSREADDDFVSFKSR